MDNIFPEITVSAEMPADLVAFISNAKSLCAAVVRCDRVIRANKNFASLFGYLCPEELISFSWASLVSDTNAQMNCNRADGSRFSAHVIKSPWASSDDLELCIIHPITPAKCDCSNASCESAEHYRALVEQAIDGIFLCSQNGIYADINTSGCEALGYGREELKHMGPLDVVVPEERESLKEAFEKTCETGRSYTSWTMLRKDGSTFPAEVSASVLSDGMVLGIVRDISAHVAAQEKLESVVEQLQRAYNLQREFLNNVTHEVRTPLTAVMGYAEMLIDGFAGPLNDEQIKLLQRVLVSSQHLLDIVSSVLEISRLKSGNLQPKLTVCNPSSLINKVLASVAPQAHKKGISLRVADLDLDQACLFDVNMLTVILTNLISNAVKFTERGGVEISSMSKDGRFCIVVADTGIGIPEHSLTKIYDEFQQVDVPRKYKPDGFGIGLAIVYTMIHAMGASLTVSSAEGIGTAFTICLPVAGE